MGKESKRISRCNSLAWPCMLAKPTRSYERKVYLPLETSYFPFCLPKSIGHFRVPKTLTFKMRLGAQPFLWKWVLFAWEWKTISVLRAEHLPSFWNRGLGELGNDLFNWSSLENCCKGPMHENKQTNKQTNNNNKIIVVVSCILTLNRASLPRSRDGRYRRCGDNKRGEREWLWRRLLLQSNVWTTSGGSHFLAKRHVIGPIYTPK